MLETSYTQDKYTLNKSNMAISISNNLTAVDRKFFNEILYIAQNNLEKSIYEVPIKNFIKLIGSSNNRQTHKKIMLIFDRLLTKLINIIIPTFKEFDKTTYLSSIKLKDGMIYFQLAESLKNHFINLNSFDDKNNKIVKPYTPLNLTIVNRLTSTYQIALYELLISKSFATREVKIDIDDLRKIISSNKIYYKDFSRFNDKILKSSIEEINKKTDLNIELMETIKGEDNKTVEKIKFIVKKHNTKQIVLNNIQQIKPLSEINQIKNFLDIGLSEYPKEIEQIINIGIKPVKKVLDWYKEDSRRVLANWYEVNTKYADKSNSEKAKLMAYLWKVNANFISRAEIETKEKELSYNIKKEAEIKEQQKQQSKQEQQAQEKTNKAFAETAKIYNKLSNKEKLELCTMICRASNSLLRLNKCTENDKYLDFNNLSMMYQTAIMNNINPQKIDKINEAPTNFISYKENEKIEDEKSLKRLFGKS